MRPHRVDLERQHKEKQMGRPINKRNFGRLANAADTAGMPYSDSLFNIKINVQVASNPETESGYIIRQKSGNKFLINDLKTGTKRTTAGSGTGNVGVCTLVNKAAGALAADEMAIQGRKTDGQYVNIKKLYNRTARDFNNVRYTWTVTDDSTETTLQLTAI
jgi:hypothetical protein